MKLTRRNALIGLGSLIAGSGALIGSGAFTTVQADRTVNVATAPDSSAYLQITALDETYASGTDTGQLELNFNEDSGNGIFDGDAKGLNADAKFTFDEVFRIANTVGQGDMRVVIEATGFDLQTLEVRSDGSESTGISPGTSLLARDYTDVDNLPKLVQPDAVDVDITIRTKPSPTGDVGGTFTIHAATGGNRDELSDVL